MRRQFSSLRQRRCPGCGASIQEKPLAAGVRVDMCPKCRALWLDHGELRELIDAPVSERSNPYALLNAEHSELECPDCAIPLLQRPFPEGSDIMLLQCRSCAGFFLEPGQLHQIQELLQGGGR